MKMLKILGVFLFVFGVFAVVGSVSAADADLVQPADVAVFNEEVQVNGTLHVSEPGYFPSVHIGSTEAGVGGVTYFNGTIINASVTEEGEDTIPVTFGDDVRIDGTIWRGETSGPGDDMPVQVMDDFYVDGVMTGGGSVVVDDDLEVNQDLTVAGAILVDGPVTGNNANFGTVTLSEMFQLPVRGGVDPNTELATDCAVETDTGKVIFFNITTTGDDSLWVCGEQGGTLEWWQLW